MLRKRECTISLVKKRTACYLKRNEKFGIKIPRNAIEAKVFDDANANTAWMDAIEKEMENVRVAFCILVDGKVVPYNHQFVRCHMIFDLKLENFWRNMRFVAGSHMTDAPPVITYASVVTHETVRIALTIAALNGLSMTCGDVMNAYITLPVTEKI